MSEPASFNKLNLIAALGLLFFGVVVAPLMLAERFPLGLGGYFLDVGVYTSGIVTAVGLFAKLMMKKREPPA